MKRIAIFAACLFLSACSSSRSTTGSTTAPTEADVQRIQVKFPDATLAKLEAGRLSFEQNCQTCHALKDPDDYSEERIRMIVPAMAEKANKKAGTVVVNSEEEVAIMEYMIAIHDRP
jgi:hypothetical protein